MGTTPEIANYFIMDGYIMSKLGMPEIKHQNFIQWIPVPIFANFLNHIPVSSCSFYSKIEMAT
jgi:hypothetical protein